MSVNKKISDFSFLFYLRNLISKGDFVCEGS